MQVYDKVNKTELTADTDELIKLMAPGGRQVDLYLKEKKSDEDGYMTWDVEHWSSVDGRRFIRCYSLEGRVLSESTGHNIYDLRNEFKPEEAEKVELSEHNGAPQRDLPLRCAVCFAVLFFSISLPVIKATEAYTRISSVCSFTVPFLIHHRFNVFHCSWDIFG